MLKKFFKYSISSMFAMFVTSLYTIMDGIFVGRGIGDVGLAAVNMVLPITIMYFGIATMFAVGGGSMVSKSFGEGNVEKGQKIFGQTVKLILIVSFILSVVAFLFSNSIMSLIGARGEILIYSSQYLKFYSLFCSANLIGIVLNSFVRNDYNPRLGMIANIFGAVANIIFDYIFIFKLNLGIKGAALATGLGQILTILILVNHFILKIGNLRFRYSPIESNVFKNIVSIGFPSFLSEITFSVIIFFYNIALVVFVGNKAVTAFSVINYINANIYMILLGMNFGVQPLISYSFGARKGKDMIKFYEFLKHFGFLLTLIYVLISFFFGNQIIGIFTSDFEIIKIAYFGLNVSNLAFFILGINLTTSVYYQAMEIPKYSNIICLFRSFVFLPISLVILAKLFGLTGIWMSLIVSEGLSLLFINFVVRVKKVTEDILSKNVFKV